MTEKEKLYIIEIISQISYECPYETLKFTFIMYFVLHWIIEFPRQLSCLINHLLHKQSTPHTKSGFLNLCVIIWLTRLQSIKLKGSNIVGVFFPLRINSSWLPLLLTIAMLLTPPFHHTSICSEDPRSHWTIGMTFIHSTKDRKILRWKTRKFWE